MIKKLNYLNILAWFTLVATPFLLQVAGIIPTDSFTISKDNGIWSILTGTFLHGSFAHMIGNLVAMMVGVALLYNFYRKMYWQVITAGIVLPSAFMYFFSDVPCLGISGLAYALVWFLIVRSLMSRDYMRFIIGIALMIFYGSTLKGAIPQGAFSRIAWEAHLVGLGVGFVLAVYSRLRRLRPVKKS